MTAAPDPALAAFAAEVGETGPVAVIGAGTRWDAGGALCAGTRLVHAPVGVCEFRPEEMTVRVRAGTPVADLHAELAARGQRSALPRRGGTVGGALAVGENDVSLLGRGRVRDAVLQLHYVSAGGALVKGGGPTVKNVSGFDLPRLLVGSLGTLGCIADAILRTNPVPPASEWVVSGDADPFAVADLVHRPSAVLWDGTSTWVELEGHRADIDAEKRRLGAGGTWTPAEGPPELPGRRSSHAPAALRGLGATPRPAGLPPGAFVASVGVGTLFSEQPAPAPAVPAPLAALGGRVKAQFDPTGRLNPGRRLYPVGP